MCVEENFVIEDGILRSCTSRDVYIRVPEGVTRIVEKAFEGLPAVRVVLPRSLREIEKRAFLRCSMLRTVILLSPEAVLPQDTFVACDIEILAVPNKEQVAYGATGYGHTLNGVLYPYNEGDEWLIEKGFRGDKIVTYLGEEHAPQVPEGNFFFYRYALAGCSFLKHIDFPETSGIPEGVLFYCTGLASVALPSKALHINKNAFRGCSSLEEIALPSGTETVCESAFSGCSSLATVHFNGELKKIEKWAFGSCTSLTELLLPPSLAEIERYAFDGCGALTRVALPSGLQDLPRDAFNRCPAISEINLPGELDELAAHMFDCVLKESESIVLPDGIRRIGAQAFADYEMREIRLPKKLIAIRQAAFAGCKNLRRIVFAGDIAVHCGEGIFVGVPSGLEIVFAGDRPTFEAMMRPYEITESSYDGGQNGGAPGLYSETYLISPLEHELEGEFTAEVFCEKDGERFTLRGTGGRKFVSSSTPYDE